MYDYCNESPSFRTKSSGLYRHREDLGLHMVGYKEGDRGKGVPSFDEMMDIALVEVDFDDPTTNVRGRRALAIAKPTPRGY